MQIDRTERDGTYQDQAFKAETTGFILAGDRKESRGINRNKNVGRKARRTANTVEVEVLEIRRRADLQLMEAPKPLSDKPRPELPCSTYVLSRLSPYCCYLYFHFHLIYFMH
jgi:hypothetical protein